MWDFTGCTIWDLVFFPWFSFHKTSFSYPEARELVPPSWLYSWGFSGFLGRSPSQNRDRGCCWWSSCWKSGLCFSLLSQCLPPPVLSPHRRESVLLLWFMQTLVLSLAHPHPESSGTILCQASSSQEARSWASRSRDQGCSLSWGCWKLDGLSLVTYFIGVISLFPSLSYYMFCI